jgi:hypothetical protein
MPGGSLSSPVVRRVGAFAAAYMLAGTLASLGLGNYEFVLYVAVMVVIAAGLAILHLRVDLSAGALWCLAVWGLAHLCGGLVAVPESWPTDAGARVLYSLWLLPGTLKYDQVVHAFGFGTTTWVCWQALPVAAGREGPLEPTFGRLLLCVAAAMGFGAANEVVEFFATITIENVNVGGYMNTGWDLVANLVGATIAATAIRLRGG